MLIKKIFDELMCAKGTIIIPDFQRRYVWTNEQCEAFFEKFISYTRKNIVNYIGNIFYLEDKTYKASSDIQYIIYDGQQRITTLRLFIYAILTIAKDYKLLSTEDILKQYFNVLNTIEFKNGDQYDFYELHKYIAEKLTTTQENEVSSELNKTSKNQKILTNNNNFVVNYNFFYNRIDEIIKDNKKDLFQKILQALRHITVIAISNDIDSKDLPLKYKIFDALNSSGLKLNIKDIINSEIETNNNKTLKNKWESLEKQFDKISLAGKDDFNDTIINYLETLGYRLTNVSPLYYFREEIAKEAENISSSNKEQEAYFNVIDNIYRYSSFNYILKSSDTNIKDYYEDILFKDDFKYINNNEELRYWLPFYIECFAFENIKAAQYLFINYITKSITFKEFCICLHFLWCVTVRNLIANNYSKGDAKADKLNTNNTFYTKVLGPRIDKSKKNLSFCEDFLNRCNKYLLDETKNTDSEQLITNLIKNYRYIPTTTKIQKGRFKNQKINFNGFCLHIVEAIENYKYIVNSHKIVAKLFNNKLDLTKCTKNNTNQLGNLFLTQKTDKLTTITKRNPDLIFKRLNELDPQIKLSTNTYDELLKFIEQRERNILIKILDATKIPTYITDTLESSEFPNYLRKL